MGLTGCGTALCIMVVCCDWCISIRLLFPCTKVSPRRSLVLVQIFSYCGHPRFRYFGSVVPVYVFALSLMWIGEIGRPMQERMKEHDTTRHDSHALRIPRFQSMPTEQDTSRYGTKPNLLTEEAIGTQRKWNRQFTWDSTLEKWCFLIVEAHNKKTSKPTTHEKPANAWGTGKQ